MLGLWAPSWTDSSVPPVCIRCKGYYFSSHSLSFPSPRIMPPTHFWYGKNRFKTILFFFFSSSIFPPITFVSLVPYITITAFRMIPIWGTSTWLFLCSQKKALRNPLIFPLFITLFSLLNRMSLLPCKHYNLKPFTSSTQFFTLLFSAFLGSSDYSISICS